MECGNFINIEIRPTDDAVRLLRIILSFASDCLDFDLDEIDEVKIAITEIFNYIRNYLSINDTVKFNLFIDKNILKSELFVPLNGKVFTLNEKSPMFIIANSLLDELLFEEEDGLFSVTMIKQKRFINE